MMTQSSCFPLNESESNPLKCILTLFFFLILHLLLLLLLYFYFFIFLVDDLKKFRDHKLTFQIDINFSSCSFLLFCSFQQHLLSRVCLFDLFYLLSFSIWFFSKLAIFINFNNNDPLFYFISLMFNWIPLHCF